MIKFQEYDKSMYLTPDIKSVHYENKKAFFQPSTEESYNKVKTNLFTDSNIEENQQQGSLRYNCKEFYQRSRENSIEFVTPISTTTKNNSNLNIEFYSTSKIIDCCSELLSNINLFRHKTKSFPKTKNFDVITDSTGFVYIEQLSLTKISLNIKDHLLYEGNLVNLEFSGEGILIDMTNDTCYEGSFKYSKFNGKGIFYYSTDNLHYEKQIGNFVNGVISGNGKLYLKDGYVYEGNFYDNSIEGNGIIYYPNNHPFCEKYIGSFENNMPNGKGQMYCKDGDILEGLWQDGDFRGEGTVTYPENHISFVKYSGGYENGAQNGYGKMLFKNGDFYQGYWKNGVFDGKGDFRYSKLHLICEKYEGFYKDCKRNGYGKMTYKDEAVYEGFWENGLANGEGVYYYPQDHEFIEKYVGEFTEDLPNGSGKMYFKDNIKLEGKWKNGIFSGHGVVNSPIHGCHGSVRDVDGDVWKKSLGKIQEESVTVYDEIHIFYLEIKEEDMESEIKKIISQNKVKFERGCEQNLMRCNKGRDVDRKISKEEKREYCYCVVF